MKELKGRVAAITGAASGIGRMLAKNLAEQGCHLAVADIDEAGLRETADMVSRSGVRVSAHTVDVSRQYQVYRFAEKAVSTHGGVQLLINNAGVTLSETLEDVTFDDFEWIMGINFWGVVYGCKAFLPHLRKEPEAHIVNLSSVFGIFTVPNNGTYCATKFAVRGFTETLCQELRHTNIRVSCVHPGGIRTNIARNGRFYKAAEPSLTREEVSALFENVLARTSADKAARTIIEGIRKNRPRIMVGPDAHAYDMLKRLFPVTLQRLAAFTPPARWLRSRL